MPSYIIKPDPDEDFYVDWSTIIDGPLSWGPAEFMNIDPERKARADKRGTSSHNGFYAWDDESLIVACVGHEIDEYLLPRKNLLNFLVDLSEFVEPNNKDGQQEVLEKYATKIVHEEYYP